MRTIAYALAAAACLTLGSVAMAQELNIGVGVGEHHDHDRAGVVIRGGERSYNRERIIVRRPHDCRMVTIRSHRPNGSVVIRQIRRCG